MQSELVTVAGAADVGRWSVADLQAAIGGRSARDLPANTSIAGVSTDTRRIAPGSVFFALRGERFDGHAFVEDALARGAVCAVVESPVNQSLASRTVAVLDCERALGDFAAWVRRQRPIKIVGITGSNGKTTTKELLAAICGSVDNPLSSHHVLKTQGNLNNLIGLPLTLLGARGDEEVGVLEMGMNRPGEIGRLAEIARPDVGLITNIGRAHLQGVGSLAGVAAAKAELFAGLPSTSTIAVNVDDEWVGRVAAPFAGRKITFGRKAEVQANRVVDLGLAGLSFELRVGQQIRPIRLPMVGAHNVYNALAAAAAGHALGLPIEVIARGLEAPLAVPMRMQSRSLTNGVTIINDSYNANPSSVEAALRALRQVPGRSVAVLGEMWELGPESERAHREIGERAHVLGIQSLVTVGPMARSIATGAVDAGMSPDVVVHCDSIEKAAGSVMSRWGSGDVVLIKGSRGMKLEEVVQILEDAGTAG